MQPLSKLPPPKYNPDANLGLQDVTRDLPHSPPVSEVSDFPISIIFSPFLLHDLKRTRF
jgi:hypothetical protein